MAKIAELDRDKIIQRFRERITLERRTLPCRAEFEQLMADFMAQMATVDNPEDIQRLCDEEIALLEEEYPQLTLASAYIPKYRKAIEQAIADQTIPITPNNSQAATQQHRRKGAGELSAEHLALTYFK